MQSLHAFTRCVATAIAYSYNLLTSRDTLEDRLHTPIGRVLVIYDNEYAIADATP
jgi:hypothetical protein